jgi:hypothetical protein
MKSKKILWAIGIIVLVIVAGVTVAVNFLNKKPSVSDHEAVAVAYGDYYIKDNPDEQYKLLDVYMLDGEQKVVDYTRKPLVKEDYSVTVKNTKTASESDLKYINAVYKNLYPEKNFTVKKAWRYNIKVYNNVKKRNETIVGFWVVKTDDGVSVCTTYDYDRSIDRSVMAKMY